MKCSLPRCAALVGALAVVGTLSRRRDSAGDVTNPTQLETVAAMKAIDRVCARVDALLDDLDRDRNDPPAPGATPQHGGAAQNLGLGLPRRPAGLEQADEVAQRAWWRDVRVQFYWVIATILIGLPLIVLANDLSWPALQVAAGRDIVVGIAVMVMAVAIALVAAPRVAEERSLVDQIALANWGRDMTWTNAILAGFGVTVAIATFDSFSPSSQPFVLLLIAIMVCLVALITVRRRHDRFADPVRHARLTVLTAAVDNLAEECHELLTGGTGAAGLTLPRRFRAKADQWWIPTALVLLAVSLLASETEGPLWIRLYQLLVIALLMLLPFFVARELISHRWERRAEGQSPSRFTVWLYTIFLVAYALLTVGILGAIAQHALSDVPIAFLVFAAPLLVTLHFYWLSRRGRGPWRWVVVDLLNTKFKARNRLDRMLSADELLAGFGPTAGVIQPAAVTRATDHLSSQP